ncbi:MAG: hypothetical protein H0T91_11770 [Propionibacteriaceae bacterium]|nr:hypothetical protein [Propionibacteriaceae bacterium]
MEFFVHSRAASGASEPDRALTEEHWSYMDRFAAGMIARGPTLAADRATWTGSVHIVDLPSAEAAHQFVEREPYNRAGMYEQHLVRRFNNLLGRTMWEFPGGSDDPIFMVISQVPAQASEHVPAASSIDPPALAPERLIVHGELLTPAEGRRVGVVTALQTPTRQAVDALLRARQPRLADRMDVQIHDWEFGGRR